MKLKITAVVLIICVLLCSCGKSGTTPYVGNEDDNIIYDPADTKGINGVYIITEKPLPVK